MLLNVIDEKISAIVERIVQAVHPLRIIFFGSTVRWQARPDSDIDSLVVMSDGTHRRKAMTNVYWALLAQSWMWT